MSQAGHSAWQIIDREVDQLLGRKGVIERKRTESDEDEDHDEEKKEKQHLEDMMKKELQREKLSKAALREDMMSASSKFEEIFKRYVKGFHNLTLQRAFEETVRFDRIVNFVVLKGYLTALEGRMENGEVELCRKIITLLEEMTSRNFGCLLPSDLNDVRRYDISGRELRDMPYFTVQSLAEGHFVSQMVGKLQCFLCLVPWQSLSHPGGITKSDSMTMHTWALLDTPQAVRHNFGANGLLILSQLANYSEIFSVEGARVQLANFSFDEVDYLIKGCSLHMNRLIMKFILGPLQLCLRKEEAQEVLQRYRNRMTIKIEKNFDKMKIKADSVDTSKKEPVVSSSQLYHVTNFKNKVLKMSAEIQLIKWELQRELMNESISTMNTEKNAILGAYERLSNEVDMLMSPNLQFSMGLEEELPRNHKNNRLAKKADFLHGFLNRLRNRCSEVKTLTSGKALIISVKDMAECINHFCSSLCIHEELEQRIQAEQAAIEFRTLQHKVFCREREVDYLKDTIRKMEEDIHHTVKIHLSEQGNSLISRVDELERQVLEYETYQNIMEQRMRNYLERTYQERLTKALHDSKSANSKFQDFRQEMMREIANEIEQETDSILSFLRENTTAITQTAHSHLTSGLKPNYGGLLAPGVNTARSISGLSSTSRSRLQPTPSSSALRSLEVAAMTASAARQQGDSAECLALQKALRSTKAFYRLRYVAMQEKYEKKIRTLEKNMTANSNLWSKLADADKREVLYKKELVNTQKLLYNAQRAIETLKEDIAQINEKKTRLENSQVKAKRKIESLEGMVRKSEKYDQVDVGKLLGELEACQKKLKTLENVERIETHKIQVFEKDVEKKVQHLNKKLLNESKMKEMALGRLVDAQDEMREWDISQSVYGSPYREGKSWKEVFDELTGQVDRLKMENTYLRQVAIRDGKSWKNEFEANGIPVNSTERTLDDDRASDLAMLNRKFTDRLDNTVNSVLNDPAVYSSKSHRRAYSSVRGSPKSSKWEPFPRVARGSTAGTRNSLNSSMEVGSMTSRIQTPLYQTKRAFHTPRDPTATISTATSTMYKTAGGGDRKKFTSSSPESRISKHGSMMGLESGSLVKAGASGNLSTKNSRISRLQQLVVDTDQKSSQL